MPLQGIICGMDGSRQDFQTCIEAHENMSATRNCHCPVASIKSQRDNAKTRTGAGISASTILTCPRAYAIEQTYPLYESVESGYHKYRGTLIHAMFEADPDPPERIIMERRVVRYVDVTDEDSVRVSGKPDYIDPLYKALIDFKSKYRVPTKLDPRHEAQINIYRYLIADGVFIDTGEICQIPIDILGIHYVTFNTERGGIWLKMNYPVWDLAETELFIRQRLEPIVAWQKTKELPACNPFGFNPRWVCDCTKYENQLQEQGITVE